MASATGFASLDKLGCGYFSLRREFSHVFCSRVPVRIIANANSKFMPPIRRRTREFRLFHSVGQDRFLTSVDEEEMGDGFFETIEEMERMAREPSDILGEMNERLSPRELQLMLVYFSQEGRDSWCALEVFEWLNKENRVDKETMELMVSIMCGWVKKLIQSEVDVGQVVDLLVDMDCVGLKPNFSMMEKVISVYWEMGKKDQASLFVEEVLRRGITGVEEEGNGKRERPAGYLAWKMMKDGNYREAVKLVVHLRESGLNPEIYSYLIALTAIVKELKELSKALRKLKTFVRAGLVSELDEANLNLVEGHQSDLVATGIQLSRWILQGGNTSLYSLVRKKLLAMYICAGRGSEAEKQLWEMKLMGNVVDRFFYDAVLAICASQGETNAVSRLLITLEDRDSVSNKKTLSWLLRGYVKGKNYEDAANALSRMLDLGLDPDYLDRVAVLQALRRNIRLSGNPEQYLKLCKRLADAELVGPCMLYMYIEKYKLWIVKMV